MNPFTDLFGVVGARPSPGLSDVLPGADSGSVHHRGSFL